MGLITSGSAWAHATEAKAAVARSHGLLLPYFLYVARLEHPAKNHARLIAGLQCLQGGDGFPVATGAGRRRLAWGRSHP